MTFQIYTPIDDNPIWEVIQKLTKPFLHMKNGPWVAGGAIRKIATNDHTIDTSDIDIFCPSKEVMSWVMDYFDKKTIFESSNSNGIYTYKHKDVIYKIQIVRYFFYKSVEELLDSFDFTATMFASDGNVIVHTQQALLDSQLKRLAFNRIQEKPKPVRLFKYAKKGFLPVPGILPALLGVDMPDYLEKPSLYHNERPADY